MAEHQSVESVLSALCRRQRRLNALRQLVRGTFVGTVAAVTAIALDALVDGPTIVQTPFVWLFIIPLGGLAGLASGWSQRIDPLRLARRLDRHADSEDRFASAFALTGHHRQQRVRLITEDALAHVQQTAVVDALPWRSPWELKWLPVAVLLSAALLWFGGGERLTAAVPPPEVTAEQWQDLEELLRRDLQERFNRPRLPEEREVAELLKELASSLAKQPDKKQVLARIAGLRSRLDKKRDQLKTRKLNLRKASGALTSSEMLRKLAELLKKGDYQRAAEELEKLAVLMQKKEANLSADDLEKLAADFERLAQQLQSHDELRQACQQCASAANQLDQESLSQALQRLSQTLKRNRDDLERNDVYSRARNTLDELERRLAQMKGRQQKCSVCQGKNSSQCAACRGNGGQRFVQRGNNAKKGGLKAGIGTAANWRGGGLSEHNEQRLPTLVPDQERDGPLTTVSKQTSTDEKAESALTYKEKYLDLVRQAEADLALEEIPLAYRDFLRRYFSAIKPEDEVVGSE